MNYQNNNQQWNGGQSYNPNNAYGSNMPYGQYPYANQQAYGQFYSNQQNPFAVGNNPQSYFANQQKFLRLREQKREIRTFSTVFALAMLAFLIVSFLLSNVLVLFNLEGYYKSSDAFSSSIGIFYSLAAVAIPFFIAKKYLSKNKLAPVTEKTIYAPPKFSLRTVCLIFLSVLGCLASMYVTGIITVFFNALGFEFASSGEPEIKNIADIIAFFVGTAIMPPLAEEFAMRNVLMQSLRKYGNLFAILASAFCFGIFHGTPNQIPFALLCGLFIGYAVTATESIWTGVIIHFIVNGISCMYYIVAYFTDEDTGDHVYYITVAVLAVLGAICGIIYSLKYKDDFKRIMAAKGPEDYKTSEKFKKFIFSPVMIIAIIIFIIEAISLIQPISEGVS